MDADLHSVAGNGQIPVQRCHDRAVLCARRFDLANCDCRQFRTRIARGSGLGRQPERWPRLLVRKNPPQQRAPIDVSLISPTLAFPAAHNAKVDTWFPGGCIRNRQPSLCKRNPRSFWEFMVCGNKVVHERRTGMKLEISERKRRPRLRHGGREGRKLCCLLSQCDEGRGLLLRHKWAPRNWPLRTPRANR